MADTPLELLRAHLRPLLKQGVALAFSGGVDSSLLLAVLKGLQPFPFLVLTMRSPFAPKAAEVSGVGQVVVDFDPLADATLAENPRERCYFCKRTFMARFLEVAKAKGLATLMDGTNADDLREPRPGLRALRELGVRSPLAECGLTKADIRAMARALGLPNADAPSAPCLATRFPYGTHLTVEALEAVAEGEAAVRALLPGVAPLRLRAHPLPDGKLLGRLEVPKAAFPAVLAQMDALRAALPARFAHLTLDLNGYRLS